MSNEITNINKIVIEQKRESWGRMGVIIHEKEMNLQAQAQEALLTLTLPNSIDEIPAHEDLLKELKRKQAFITEKRKEITCKFDAVTQRLMEPEKSLIKPIEDLTAEIIKLKKQDQGNKKLEQAKQDEIKRLKERIAVYMAEVHAKNLTIINETINECYTYALGSGNVKPDELEEYIELQKSRFTAAHFQPRKLNVPASAFIDDETSKLIILENYNPRDPAFYIDLYNECLENKFSDYEVAFNNKQEALNQAKDHALKNAQEIAEQQENNIAAAKLESLSSEVIINDGIKPLKESYAVDMEETIETVIAIQKAFIQHLNLCLPKLNVKKWFSFTVQQMAGALAKVKSDDNSFSPPGITFKIVEKL